MTPVQEGQVLAGKYRVERVLGVGGMGVVVSALHIQLDERVALKFLLPEALANEEAVARFAREARAAVKIKSMHVARVSDVGTLETGAPYMVMEYLHGNDLSVLLRERGPMPYPDAVDLILQACEALAEAHTHGIVHRDLKPANLFLITGADGSPCIKVLDFGISKLTNPNPSSGDYGMTRTQAIMGSPLYMSPEQMTSSRDVDGRADIWALGTILFELLTGRPPFLGDSMPQLCGMILQEAPPLPRQLRPDLPDGLQAVLLRCLEKKREARFANVAELATALAPFGTPNATRSAERVSRVLNAAGISSRQLEISSEGLGMGTSSAWGTTQRNRSSHRTLWVSLGVAGILLVIGGAFFLRHSAGTTANVPSAEPPVQVPGAVPVPPATTAATAVAVPAAPLAVSATPIPAPSEAVPSSTPPAPSKASSKTARPRPTVAKTAPAKTATAKPAATPPPATRPAIDPLEGRR
jgi:eukaryotic-like serine/threonine-protein kinase